MAASSSSERYMVTARKYRPARFNELVAQGHVSDTLKNAIRLDRLAHAYLFSGPRGVGKTTAARILAKAINCTTPLEERDDGAEPCRECNSCKSFEEGRSLGIFEIDAASNNKVDDIRELRETVRVPPQGSKNKVYIIDEVHMLSNQAFNALLKTLEEPPPHVLFIFATTEPHKVLPTILSRCQRFDFRRIPIPDIVERLREICSAEEIDADEESLMLLAKKGDGALRDALSAFDQAVSLCGTKLVYAELVQALGVVDLELYFRLTDHIAQRDSSDVLELVDEVMQSGYDLQEFLAGVAEHMRNILVSITTEDTALIQAARKTRERYADQARQFSESDVLRLLMVVGDAEDDVKTSSQPRLKLEMALLKMASLTRVANLERALAQLEKIDKAIADGDPITFVEPSSTAKASTSSPEQPDPTPPSVDKRSSEKDAASDDPSRDKPCDSGSSDEGKATGATSTPTQTGQGSDTNRSDVSARPSKKNPASSPSEDSSSSYRTLFNRPALGDPSDHAPDAEEVNGGDGSVAVLEAPPDVKSGQTATEDVEGIAAYWEDFVSSIRTDKIMVGSYLQRSRLLTLERNMLRVAVPDTHSRDLLDKHERYLLAQLPDEIDEAIEGFNFIIQNDLEDAANAETDLERDPYEMLRRLREEHDVIRALFDKFGGEIVH